MPHAKLPEHELEDARKTLKQIKDELPVAASGDSGPRKELITALNAVSRAKTDMKQWREFVDDSEVME